MKRIAAARQAFWTRRLDLKIIGQVTPLANLILIHASNLSFLRGFLPPSGCVVYTTNGFLSRLNVWGTAVTATSRMLIGTLALTQLCDPIPSFAAKNKPASQTVMVKLPAATPFSVTPPDPISFSRFW